MRRNVFLAVCSAAFSILGCGSGADFDTGLDESEPLGADREATCTAEQAYLGSEDVKRITCRPRAAIAALFQLESDDVPIDEFFQSQEFQDQCAARYEDCMEDSRGEAACTLDDEGGCTATVADYEECMNDLIARLADFPDCTSISEDKFAIWGESPESCGVVEASCFNSFDLANVGLGPS